MLLDVGGFTHIGPRKNNEDSFGILQSPVVVALSDGMGGHPDGEVASSITVTSFLKAFKKPKSDPIKQLAAAMQDVDLDIQILGRKYKHGREPGCTLVAGYVDGNTLYLANVGDSRCTMIHKGRLKQLTTDHNVPGAMLEAGRLSREQARVHPMSNQLLNCLGGGHSVDREFFVEYRQEKLLSGAVFVFTTDGVHGALTDQQLLRTVQRSVKFSAVTMAEHIVRAALGADTSDNATCAVLRVM